MAERLTLLDKWKILETIMRDLSLARNDLIVSQDLLEHYHDKVNGSRSASRLIATRTGLARSRVSDCLNRLIDGGHFTIIAGQQRGSKATVYAPRKREAGPVHGASSAEHGPVHGSTKSPGGPVHGSTTGPVDGSTNAATGPVHGSNKSLRKSHLAPARSETSRLGPTTDAARSPSPPAGAPVRAPPVEPTPAKTIERLNAAATAGVAGGVWLSPRDLHDALGFLSWLRYFPKHRRAEFTEIDLCWARLCAALRNGEAWAALWIDAAARWERHRNANRSANFDWDGFQVIYAAFEANKAPLPLRPTPDAARDQPPVGATGRAPPVEPAEIAQLRRLCAAAAAFAYSNPIMSIGSGGRHWISPDLRDAHEFVFCGENLNLKGHAADFAEFDLCWTQMCAALRAGEPWATAWIEAAAAAKRDEEASDDDLDGDRLEVIYAAFRAGTAPSTA